MKITTKAEKAILTELELLLGEYNSTGDDSRIANVLEEIDKHYTLKQQLIEELKKMKSRFAPWQGITEKQREGFYEALNEVIKLLQEEKNERNKIQSLGGKETNENN